MKAEWILFCVLQIPGSAALPLDQHISPASTCHALANAITDQLNEQSQVDIDPMPLANILFSYSEHVAIMWPGGYHNYLKPLTTMDEKTDRWISIKTKTVKRVENSLIQINIFCYTAQDCQKTFWKITIVFSLENSQEICMIV